MKAQTVKRLSSPFRAPIFVVCMLAITLAACSEKPPSENDAKMAVQYHLLGKYGDGGPGFSESRRMADGTCFSQFNSPIGCTNRSEPSEWVGRVKEVVRVTEIAPSKKETVLTTRTNRYGVSSWDTYGITVWPVTVQLILECICRDRTGPVAEVPNRTFTTTKEYKLRYHADSKEPWSVHSER